METLYTLKLSRNSLRTGSREVGPGQFRDQALIVLQKHVCFCLRGDLKPLNQKQCIMPFSLRKAANPKIPEFPIIQVSLKHQVRLYKPL